ncbi:MAG TPA: prepilin-type N-terminal cleavage/methylation domain-containing protein [Burkholderiales bacterium]|nr:prepilin-type N-terminal cleavage/methylation domain-containing protein [Burkholderiales bacterium]
MQSCSSKYCKPQGGFTLIELMITVAVIAVLAAIAVPNYSDYVLRAKLVEPAATLSGQRVKMEQYFQDARTYTGACVNGTVAPRMQDTDNFTYNADCGIAADGQSYLLTATGKGSLSGFVFSLDQSNNRATTVSGAAATKGYSSAANCWVRKKPNQC